MTTLDMIWAEMDRLNAAQQNILLQCARALTQRPAGVKVKEMKNSIGSLSAEDAEELRIIIEKGCEQIDVEKW